MLNIWAFPGLGADERIFEPLFAALSERGDFRFKVFNFPEPPDRRQDLAAYARLWAADLQAQAEIEQPVLLGFSLGGIALSYLALDLPHRGRIYISTARSPQALSFYTPALRYLPLHRLVPAWFSYHCNPRIAHWLGIMDAEGAAVYGQMLRTWSPRKLAWARQMVVHWRLPEQALPTLPCLHLHGEKDHIFPARKSGADLILPQASHDMIRQDAQVLAEAIMPFLAICSTAAPASPR